MYKTSDFTKDTYKTKEIMEILGVSYETIKYYDRNNKFPFKRNGAGRRIVFREDLLTYLDKKGLLFHDEAKTKRDVIYARVSSNEQKQKGDLDRQAIFLMKNVDNLINPLVLTEVGSGLNDRRKRLQELIRMVMEDEVSRVFITYRDRLTRFGYRYLETVFNLKGVPIIAVKDEAKIKSVNEELAEDMMSLIASFSGKLYGLRSGRNKNKEPDTKGEGDGHE